MSKCRKIHNKGNCASLHCNISSAQEYLTFILDVSEFILSNIANFSEVNLNSVNIKLEDVVLCNQRLFCFVSKDKYFSINFPMEVNNKTSLIHFRDCKIDLMSISHVKGAINDLFNGFQKYSITLEESNNKASSVLSNNELRFVEQILSAANIPADAGMLLIIGAMFVPKDVTATMPLFTGSSFEVMVVPLSALLLVLCGLCTSVMWASIFNLATEGLGKYTAQASGIFMMMVVGGGVLPLIQNYIADNAGYMVSYIVPLLAMAYMFWYALAGSKNVNTDIPVE